MQVKPLKIDPFKFIGFILIGIIIAFIISFTFLPKYTKIKELVEENAALSQKINEVRKDIEVLKKDLENIKKDPFYLEKTAREQLGAVKEGEVVIDIEE